ncbi:hypothetical protein KY284_023764 [Solanum tuberosum]|nr:hypothetical protein KY284_023764 [Solanum tuberosum]
MKEEYSEGMFETLKVDEDIVSEQLKGALDHVVKTFQQLLVPLRDIVSRCLKIPLDEDNEKLLLKLRQRIDKSSETRCINHVISLLWLQKFLKEAKVE